MRIYRLSYIAAVACLLHTTPVFAQDASDVYQALGQYQVSPNRTAVAQIEELIRKTSSADYPAIETKLLSVLNDASTTEDAKRAICRMLVTVGSKNCVQPVAKLLLDAQLSHPARIVLESVQDPSAGAALRASLNKAQDKILLGIIASLGIRHEAESVIPLTSFAQSENLAIATAAIISLGEIGTSEAVAVLNKISRTDINGHVLDKSFITAANRLILAGQREQAAGIFDKLIDTTVNPRIKISAYLGLTEVLPAAKAVSLLLSQAENVSTRSIAQAVFSGAKNLAVKNAVAAKLPEMKSEEQLFWLGLIAGRPEVDARLPIVETLAKTDNDPVRIELLNCLSVHGSPMDIPQIIRFAKSTTPSVADAARKTLESMSKPGVDAFIVQQLEIADATDRGLLLTAVANRRIESAFPLLERFAVGNNPPQAKDAIKAIGILGKPDQITALANIISKSQDITIQNAAAAAIKSICNRMTDKGSASEHILSVLTKTDSITAKTSLLPLLNITAGEAALTMVRQALGEEDPRIKEAAVRTLIDWPEITAAPMLIEIAKTTQNPTQAILALRDGALRLAESEDAPLAERLNVFEAVIKTAKRLEEKKLALAGIGQLPTPNSFKLLNTYLQEPALKNDAAQAIITLSSQLNIAYPKQVMEALEQLKSNATGDLLSKVEQAIKAARNSNQFANGFIISWLLAGPYQQEGLSGTDLFNVAFPAEKNDASVSWRVVTANTSKERLGIVDIDRIFSGNNRVAYLKTQIISELEQDATFEFGSDDGIKVWLNNKVVHANNTTRGCSPGQDKARGILKKGPNTLLIKITQDGGEWSAVCRLSDSKGKPLATVTILPE